VIDLLNVQEKHLKAAVNQANRQHLTGLARRLESRLRHDNADERRLHNWIDKVQIAAERRRASAEKKKNAAEELAAAVAANDKGIRTFLGIVGTGWSYSMLKASAAALGYTGRIPVRTFDTGTLCRLDCRSPTTAPAGPSR
jgi:septal ring factor EnvC (AmiA/AmiB activator)